MNTPSVLKRSSFIILCLLSFEGRAQEQQDFVTIDDLDMIIGAWEGQLTYTDYRSGEPYTMPVEASITAGKKASTLLIGITYPNEPKANNMSKIVISKDGSKINKQTIVSRIMNASGELTIIAEETGKDDNRKATIRHTYILGQSRFINRKEVRFSVAEDWLLRREFSYRRQH